MHLNAIRRIASVALAALCAVCALGLHAAPVLAQGATITGTVRDSAARPVAGADVVANPGAHRTKTDSAGHFAFTGLDADSYTIHARKIGFAPTEWRASVSKNGHLDIHLSLDHRAPMLDTVTVFAGRECPLYSLDGFVCRRHTANGVFLDYTEIDDKDVAYTADLFRDVSGFRVDVRSTVRGPQRIPVASNGYGCITSLVDGHPATAAYAIPTVASDLVGIEIYAKPDSVPAEFQRYTWPKGSVARTGRCSVVIYWTLWAPMSR